jgi:hypothetical protein
MKVLYMAGAYRADTIRNVVLNIRAAEQAALSAWEQGHGEVAVFSPHLNTALFDGVLDDEVWLNAGLEMVRRSDALGLTWGWEKSEGVKAEIKEAVTKGLPVFEFPDDRVVYKAWAKDLDDFGILYSLTCQKRASEGTALHKVMNE